MQIDHHPQLDDALAALDDRTLILEREVGALGAACDDLAAALAALISDAAGTR